MPLQTRLGPHEPMEGMPLPRMVSNVVIKAPALVLG